MDLAQSMSTLQIVIIPIIPADGVIQPRVELNQGWNKEKRQLFWFTSQGSRVVPYSLYALEQASV